jgi:hypothetical protein
MMNKARCLSLINEFNEDQLANIAALLENVKALADEAADDAYCLRLYADYQASADKGDEIALEDFAKSLGVSLS